MAPVAGKRCKPIKPTPLLHAISCRPRHKVESLIKKGANINEVFYDWSPLRYAVHEGYLAVVQLLIDHGADISVRSMKHNNLLHTACLPTCYLFEDCYEICELLIGKGVDCNSPNKLGITPLHWALAYRPLEIVKLFLDNGASIGTVGPVGCTALHYAARNPCVEVIEFVFDQGLDIGAVLDPNIYKENFTPLLVAVCHGNYKGCKFLLEHGAMVDRWCLLYALDPPLTQCKPDPKIVELLLEHGAVVDQEILTIPAAATENNIRELLVQHLAKNEHQNPTLS